MAERVPVVLLTGTVGSGKTTVAYEMNDALAARKVPNAAIDLDALAVQWPPSSRWNADLVFASLAALWPVQRAHGARRLILARVMEDRADLDHCRAAIPGAEITVVRLVAPEELRLQRITSRMPDGASREWHLERTVELDEILVEAALEDFAVVNDDRPVRDVAVEVLDRLGWI